MTYDYLIGIDPGRKNGLAIICVFDEEKHMDLMTAEGLVMLFTYLDLHIETNLPQAYTTFIRVEDARQRGGGKDARLSDAKRQGAGSVKAVCREIETYLEQQKVKYPGLIDYEMTPPVRNGTKWPAKQFKQITGYPGKTSQHSRDAAMLIWNWTPKPQLI